jgi:hypothetical protein
MTSELLEGEGLQQKRVRDAVVLILSCAQHLNTLITPCPPDGVALAEEDPPQQGTANSSWTDGRGSEEIRGLRRKLVRESMIAVCE